MEEFFSTLQRSGIVRAQGRLESGNVVDTILKVATTGKYDMVVMNTHGRSGLSRLLMGSKAEKVVRLAPCPVVTVPSGVADSDGKGP